MGRVMRVVLLQDVSGLGKAGEIREVSDGYGRNFLIPKGLAEFAAPSLLKRVEEQRHAQLRRLELAGAGLASFAETLQAAEITVKAKVGAQGRLYGAVTNSDIAREIQRVTGQEIDKRKIEIEQPIHQLGQYEVLVRLSKDLVPSIRVIVEGENG